MRVTSASVVSVCAWIGMVAVSPAWSQQPPADLPSAVAATRAAAGQGKHVEAFRLGVQTLDAFPEEAWNQGELKAFYYDVTDRLFKRMSRDEQRTAVAAVQLPPSTPAAQAAMLWGRCMSGQQENVWDEGWALLNREPKSFGAGRLIEGALHILVAEGRFSEQGRAEVMEFVGVAPDNPATAWAACHVSWWLCVARGLKEARKTNDEIIEKVPNTLVAMAAARLNSQIEAIEATRYVEAFAAVATLREYWQDADFFEGDTVVSAFLARSSRAGGSDSLERAANEVAGSASQPQLRDLALCVTARLYERQRKREEAKATLERVLNGGPAWGGIFAMPSLARLYIASDRQRAIALLERCRTEYDSVPHVSLLGSLYILSREYAKGLEVFSYLETLRNRGQLWVKGYSLLPRTKILQCLAGLAREQEAQALAGQLLQESSYESGLAQMNREELEAAAGALEVLGRASEAAACKAKLAEP